MVMQREEFSERAQTQKMDTNQGERARLENRRRFSGELAEGALQFFALEQTLVARREALERGCKPHTS